MEEIEVCFRVDSNKADELRNRLKDFFVRKNKETDIYFFPPHKDFLMTKDGKENLRVRDTGNKKELTYKNVVYNDYVYSHSIEKNIKISDTNEAIEILKSLGFRMHLPVEKEREFFENPKFLMTIDNVKDLGLFVEIEWKGNTENKENALKECMSMAGELGLKEIEKKGYLRLLEDKFKPL